MGIELEDRPPHHHHYRRIPSDPGITCSPVTRGQHCHRTSSYSLPRGSKGLLDSEEYSEETPLLIHKSTEQSGQNGISFNMLKESSTHKDHQNLCKKPAVKSVLNHTRVAVIFCLTTICTVIFAMYPNIDLNWKQFSVSRVQEQDITINAVEHSFPILKLYMLGAFSSRKPSRWTENVTLTITNTGTNKTMKWVMSLPGRSSEEYKDTLYTEMFDYSNSHRIGNFVVHVNTTTFLGVPIALAYNVLPPTQKYAVAFAAIILVSVYALITFDLVHRTLAAMIGSLAALSVLATLNEKPSLEQMVQWLDYETLCLLFGMMVIVAIFVETGFFDWVALVAFKLVKGKTWPLITTLCVFSMLISAFLDNVTTLLLLAPITIRLCEALDLDPKHVLIAEVMFANIGGTATAVGDPPNVILISNSDLKASGIDFSKFTLHMVVGTLFVMVAAYVLLRLIYRKKEFLAKKDSHEVAELKHEIGIWRRTCNRIVVASSEESMVRELLMQKIHTLEGLVREKQEEHRAEGVKFLKLSIHDMEKKYYIRDYPLLIKCLLVLASVIACFFINSFVESMNLGLGWIAILGAILLLILSDYKDLDSVLERIEWATLLFFCALFVMMQALNQLGLISYVADCVVELIQSVPQQSRLAVAILVILWVSAILSSFVDNIPFTTAMVPVIVQLSSDSSVCLPLEPLVWALAFGACLGGNGTLIGASANVVCAGISETHGHRLKFIEFFKVGFPMVLVTSVVVTIYLMISHVAFQWHTLPQC